jgi:MFS family permease
LHELSDVDEATAQRTLTAYLIASACGMLVGGWIADRFQRHDLIAIVGVGVGALLFLAIGVGGFTFPVVVALMLTAGAAVGTVAPSRDLLIRRASPPGARGKVFGLVYSGLDAGSAVAPTLFGLLMDLHQPELMYATVAVLLAASIPTVLAVERSGRAER